MVDIQSVAAEIRRRKKRKIEERNHRAKYSGLPYYRAAIISSILVFYFAAADCKLGNFGCVQIDIPCSFLNHLAYTQGPKS